MKIGYASSIVSMKLIRKVSTKVLLYMEVGLQTATQQNLA